MLACVSRCFCSVLGTRNRNQLWYVVTTVLYHPLRDVHSVFPSFDKKAWPLFAHLNFVWLLIIRCMIQFEFYKVAHGEYRGCTQPNRFWAVSILLYVKNRRHYICRQTTYITGICYSFGVRRIE